MFKEYFWDVITKHYADFTGRATRKQFWIFFVFYIIIFVTLVCLIPIITFMMTELFICALFVPYFAITLRRFRDAGVSIVWLAILKGLQGTGVYLLCLPFIFVFLMVITLGGFDPQEATLDNLLRIGRLLFCLSFAVELIICALPSKKVLPNEQVLSNEHSLHREKPNEQIK